MKLLDFCDKFEAPQCVVDVAKRFRVKRLSTELGDEKFALLLKNLLIHGENLMAEAAPHGGDDIDEFSTWLRVNKIHVYQQALEDEGYDDVESFSMIPENEIEALCETVKMKPGNVA